MKNGKVPNTADPASGGKMFTGTQGVHIHESLTRVPNVKDNPGENLSNSMSADSYNKGVKYKSSTALPK